MKSDKSRRATIKFRCRLDSGEVCHFGESDTIELVLGVGKVAPSLEKLILGMKPGEHRIIRVPAAEVPLIPFPKPAETPPGISYDFGPGDAGDVAEFIPPRTRHPREIVPAGADLDLEVQLLSLDDKS